MYGWAGNTSASASGDRGNGGGPQEGPWGTSPGAGGEIVGGSLGGEGLAGAGVGGAYDGAYGVQGGYETSTSSLAPPPPPSHPLAPSSSSNYANQATLYGLLHQGIISQDQFDVLVTVPPPPGRTMAGGALGESYGGGQQPTGQQGYAPPPAAPNHFPTPAPPPAQAPYHLASTSAPLYHPIPPPPKPYQQARPPLPQAYQQPHPPPPPPQQQRPLPTIPAHELQSHLVAMDQIQVWQQRLRMLMDSLLSGSYPPGVANAQPIGQAQRESMEREVGELKSRQSSLINQCQTFIARSGGAEHVSSQVRVFRPRPPQLAAPLPSPPLNPLSALQPPTPNLTPPVSLPTPPPQPLYHSSSANSNLSIGPQGLAGRAQARSMQPTTFPSSRPASALASPATTGGSPKQDEGPRRKSATQILSEGRPGMQTLAQLQAQLSAPAFKDSHAKVLKKKGIALQEFRVENRLVSLYDLYQTVMTTGGGGQKVAADNSWNRIANLLNYRHDSGPRLAEIYRAVLAPYEEVWSEVLLKQQEGILAARANGGGGIETTRGTTGDTATTRSGSEAPTTARSSTPSAMGPQQQLHAIGLGALPSQVQASTTASRFASSQNSSYDSLPSLSQPAVATPDTDSPASPSTWRSPAPPVVDLPSRRTDISEVLAEARRLKEAVSARKARDAASSQPRPPSAQSQLRHSVPSNPLPLPLHPALAASHVFTPPTPTVGLSDLFALTTTGPRQLPDSGQFDELREPPTKQRRVGGLAQTAAAPSPAESTKSAGSAKAGEEGTAGVKKRTRSVELLEEEDSGGSPMSFADALGASQRGARPFDFARIPSFAPSFAPAPPPSSEVRNFDPFPSYVTPSSAIPPFDPFLSFSPSHLSPSHSTVETPELAAGNTELSPPSDVENERSLGNLSTFDGYDPLAGFGSATGLSDWGRGAGPAKWDEEARWGLGGEFGDAGGYGSGGGNADGGGFGMEGDAFGRYGWASQWSGGSLLGSPPA